jgi:hypothetical protein
MNVVDPDLLQMPFQALHSQHLLFNAIACNVAFFPPLILLKRNKNEIGSRTYVTYFLQCPMDAPNPWTNTIGGPVPTLT